LRNQIPEKERRGTPHGESEKRRRSDPPGKWGGAVQAPPRLEEVKAGDWPFQAYLAREMRKKVSGPTTGCVP